MDWLKDNFLFSKQQATKEFDISLKEKYRVTTIKWGYSECEHTLRLDEKNVHKCIYEMTLNDFMTDWTGHFNRHPDKDIIKVERLKNPSYIF